MVLKNLANIQAYTYLGIVILLAIFLYGYIYYLYSRQKSGHKDFEKYGDLALRDDIHDAPVEGISKNKDKKDGGVK